MITARQGEILNRIVREYITGAEPVSSQLLEKKHKLGICPATIRIEMQKLTDKGYLYQPHTSAGRIPTDKGYRFFVDELLEKELEDFGVNLEKEIKGSFEFIRSVTQFLASESSDLALGYLVGEEIFWKEGWREILREPEFEEAGYASRFAQMIDDLERNIENLLLPEMQVYIGRENPVSEVEDFSIIASGFSGGLFAILGPKRMSYPKNISLLHKIWQKI